MQVILFLFELILYVPDNNFLVMLEHSWVEPVLSWS